MANLVHGGDIYSAREKGINEILDFSANINPKGLPEKVKRTIIDCLDTCINYPDPLCRELVTAISEFEKIDKNNIICGNGAADIIFRLVLALKPKEAMVLAPTFAEYEQALDTVGCNTKHFVLKEEENFEINQKDYLDSLEETLDVVFLCNPNNPTGQLVSKEFLEMVLEKCIKNNILLVIDECFIEFVENFQQCTMKEYIEKCKQIFILKAFTKSYAMPGIRLGYGMSSDDELLHRIEQMGQPWSVSIIAQVAGIQALKEVEYLEESLKDIRKERTYLVSKLSELGIKTYMPTANYIFFNINGSENYNITDFKSRLLDKGIIIRDCSNYIGLTEGYYRIAVKSHRDNERLVNALKSIV